MESYPAVGHFHLEPLVYYDREETKTRTCNFLRLYVLYVYARVRIEPMSASGYSARVFVYARVKVKTLLLEIKNGKKKKNFHSESIRVYVPLHDAMF